MKLLSYGPEPYASATSAISARLIGLSKSVGNYSTYFQKMQEVMKKIFEKRLIFFKIKINVLKGNC